MRDVAIIGVGMHPFGRFEGKPWQDIGLEAATMALKDAGISWKRIETAYCSRVHLPSSAGVKILTRLGRTGIPIVDIEAACASGAVALKHACLAVATEQSDYAMALGVEKLPRGFLDPREMFDDWQINVGFGTTPMYWALRARHHMARYGTTELQIAKVAHKNHRNSVLNPYAMYQREFSLEEILNSRVVTSPIKMLEICAPNEGAAAVIVCPLSGAGQHTSKPVKVAACEHRISLFSSYFNAPAFQMSTRLKNPSPIATAGRAAYEAAGVGPADVDLAEVQDTWAFTEMEIYEELEFCQEGESGRLVDEGTTERNGKLPVNVSGGLISKGEPVGASHLGQVTEMVWQLRGEAGSRQIPNAKVGLCQVVGASGHAAVTILTA